MTWLTDSESIPANATPPATSTFDIWSSQAFETTPPSCIGMQHDSDLLNLPTEPLGAMLDMETDFDWVSLISLRFSDAMDYIRKHVLTYDGK